MNRRKTIGFDRRLALDWLEATGSRVAAGASLVELRAGMWEYLEGKVSGDKYNSDRGKTMTVLTRIWGKVPPAVEPLKTRAVAAFQTTVKRHPLLALWRHENWSTWRLADGAFLGALGSVFHRCLSCRCGLGRHPVPPLLGFPSGLLTGRRWPQASAVR